MKLGIKLCFFLGAFAGFAAFGCSSDSDSNTSSTGGTGGTSAVAAGTHDIGESCPNGMSDCKTGLSCATEDPNGQCIKLCTPHTDADCGDITKFACSDEGHCYLKCTTTADCKRASEGYACVDDSPPRDVKFCDTTD